MVKINVKDNVVFKRYWNGFTGMFSLWVICESDWRASHKANVTLHEHSQTAVVLKARPVKMTVSCSVWHTVMYSNSYWRTSFYDTWYHVNTMLLIWILSSRSFHIFLYLSNANSIYDDSSVNMWKIFTPISLCLQFIFIKIHQGKVVSSLSSSSSSSSASLRSSISQAESCERSLAVQFSMDTMQCELLSISLNHVEINDRSYALFKIETVTHCSIFSVMPVDLSWTSRAFYTERESLRCLSVSK